MRIAGMLTGGLIALFGLSIIFTPMRTYFLIGKVIAFIFLCNGLATLVTSLKKGQNSTGKRIISLVITLIGVVLLVSDLYQVLTQIFIVYLVAGGILLSGLVECLVGYRMVKSDKTGFIPLILGVISVIVGLVGLIYQNATIFVIGAIVGYHITRMGLSVFLWARNINKPQVIDLHEDLM